MSDMDKVSIVIPAKNEEKNLLILLKRLKKLYGKKYEIIVVDDASTDKTSEVAKKFDVKLVKNIESHGKGLALRQGFTAATGNIIVDVDADLSHKPEDIPKLLEPLKNKKIGLVIGSRSLGGSEEYEFVRALGNVLLSGACNLFLGTHLYDALNGFRAFRKEIINELKCNRFEIEIEIIGNCIRKGYESVEVASQEKSRRKGKSHLNTTFDGFNFFKQIIVESIKLKLSR